jgi:hypothetical protein
MTRARLELVVLDALCEEPSLEELDNFLAERDRHH